jgi:hypothetical protein
MGWKLGDEKNRSDGKMVTGKVIDRGKKLNTVNHHQPLFFWSTIFLSVNYFF